MSSPVAERKEPVKKKKSNSHFVAPPKCAKCDKGVYPLEKVEACDKNWHKQCFRCKECNGVLSLKAYATINNDPYCKPHYMALFKSKGNYGAFSGGTKGGTGYTGMGFQGVSSVSRRGARTPEPKTKKGHAELTKSAPAKTETADESPQSATPSPATNSPARGPSGGAARAVSGGLSRDGRGFKSTSEIVVKKNRVGSPEKKTPASTGGNNQAFEEEKKKWEAAKRKWEAQKFRDRDQIAQEKRAIEGERKKLEADKKRFEEEKKRFAEERNKFAAARQRAATDSPAGRGSPANRARSNSPGARGSPGNRGRSNSPGARGSPAGARGSPANRARNNSPGARGSPAGRGRKGSPGPRGSPAGGKGAPNAANTPSPQAQQKVDTPKQTRDAKIEMLKKASPSASPQGGRSHFVAPPKCAKCDKGVYALEKVDACDKIWHKACFRCKHCNGVLSLKAFATINNDPYCKPHYMELFKSKGNYGVFSGGEKGGTGYTGQGFTGVSSIRKSAEAKGSD